MKGRLVRSVAAFAKNGLRAVAGLIAVTTLTGAGIAVTHSVGRVPSTLKPLKQIQNIPLPGVKGGFDLMAIDMPRRRLMVDAEDNGTTEVLDVTGKGARVTTIRGMSSPKWVAYRPELDKVYVANGDGRVRILRARDYAPLGAIKFDLLANNLRYDSASANLLVGLGGRTGAIAVVDAKTDRMRRRLALDAFPKQFEIDGDRLYVNEPSKNIVQVLNWKTGDTLARWPACRAGNVPMALDATGHRLFVGCEEGRLLVLDTRSGKQIGRIAIATDCDGIYRDGAHHLLYVSARQGVVDVLKEAGVGRLARIQRVATRPGAGTSLFVPGLHRLFVALPQTSAAPAAVIAFATP